jgi:GNAT superfamily N-acetyltransferase
MVYEPPSSHDVALRTARSDELPLLRDIDDDACQLYERHGVHLAPLAESAFAAAEVARWARCLEAGDVFFALSGDGAPIGFAALRPIDGEAYLDQLSVRLSAMRRGAGKALIERACAWARDRGDGYLWLTTYDHVPFNRPMYERRGFTVVDEASWGPEIAADVEEQRRALPFPRARVVMRRAVR